MSSAGAENLDAVVGLYPCTLGLVEYRCLLTGGKRYLFGGAAYSVDIYLLLRTSVWCCGDRTQKMLLRCSTCALL